LAVVALVGTVADAGGARSAAAASSPTISFTRLAGADRYDTAAKLAESAFPAGARTVIGVSGFTAADGLVASYLAGALDAPVLLMPPSGPVPAATVAALGLLQARSVILLGLDASIGHDVQVELAATPSTAAGAGNLQVSRIGGQTRYDTMSLVDETPDSSSVGDVNGLRTALVASGTSFADALSVAPLAFDAHLPLILTTSDTLNLQAIQTLQGLGIEQVVLAGGPLALSPEVEAEANFLGIKTLVRFAGTDRTDTARLVGDWAIRSLGFSAQTFALASGDGRLGGFDALALGPLVGLARETIQLVQDSAHTGPGALQFVRDNRSGLNVTTADQIAGGEVAVPDLVVAPIAEAYAHGTGVTVLPELVGAEMTASGSAAAGVGPVVRFEFDSALGSLGAPSSFLLYDPTRPDAPLTAGAGNVTVDAVDPDGVDVTFPPPPPGDVSFTPAVAAVLPGAVGDPTGLANPTGAIAIDAADNFPVAAGTTEAPGLVGVVSSRVVAAAGAAPAMTAIDVRFDKPAFSTASDPDRGDFGVVYTDHGGTTRLVGCTAPGRGSVTASGGTVPGGQGTAVWTVVCPDDPATPGQVLAVGRVIVHQGTLATAAPPAAGETAQYMEASQGPRASTSAPDLLSVVVYPPTSFGMPDTMIATFDVPVTPTSAAAAAMTAVLADGSSAPASSVAQPNPGSTNVEVAFDPGVGPSAVGLAVGSSAVVGASGPEANVPNAPDELVAVNPRTVNVAPGLTEGPSLLSATLSSFAPGGVPTGEAALLTLDEPLAGPAPSLDQIHAFNADGTELTCAAPSTGAGANGLDVSDNPFPDAAAPNTVQCDDWTVGPTPGGVAAPIERQQSIVLVTIDAGAVSSIEDQHNLGQAVATTGGTGVPLQG
jgi:putative cell wall-binding protein